MGRLNVTASVEAYIDSIYKAQPTWMRDRAHVLTQEVIDSLNVSKHTVEHSEAEVRGRLTTLTIWTNYKHHSVTITLELYHGDDNFSVKGKVKTNLTGML